MARGSPCWERTGGRSAQSSASGRSQARRGRSPRTARPARRSAFPPQKGAQLECVGRRTPRRRCRSRPRRTRRQRSCQPRPPAPRHHTPARTSPRRRASSSRWRPPRRRQGTRAHRASGGRQRHPRRPRRQPCTLRAWSRQRLRTAAARLLTHACRSLARGLPVGLKGFHMNAVADHRLKVDPYEYSCVDRKQLVCSGDFCALRVPTECQKRRCRCRF